MTLARRAWSTEPAPMTRMAASEAIWLATASLPKATFSRLPVKPLVRKAGRRTAPATSSVVAAAVMMPAFAGLPLLGFVLIGCYVMDRRTWPAAGLAPWLPMRLQLTTVASLSCFLAAGAT